MRDAFPTSYSASAANPRTLRMNLFFWIDNLDFHRLSLHHIRDPAKIFTERSARGAKFGVLIFVAPAAKLYLKVLCEMVGEDQGKGAR